MSTEKYISFQQLPQMRQAKTKRWYVLGRDKKPFAIIKWYGGWRKYVCYFEKDSYIDQNALRKIMHFLEDINVAHKQQKKHGIIH